LLRLIAGHPELDLVAATAHTQAGLPVAAVHPQLAGLDLVLGRTEAAGLADADLVFLALPHGQSAALAAQLPAGVKIVDLGADFRLHDGEAWTRYYGGTHAGTWTYGLPELPGARAAIAASDRVASTGCYAATITLALAPLIASGVADPEDVVGQHRAEQGRDVVAEQEREADDPEDGEDELAGEREPLGEQPAGDADPDPGQPGEAEGPMALGGHRRRGRRDGFHARRPPVLRRRRRLPHAPRNRHGTRRPRQRAHRCARAGRCRIVPSHGTP
jgi:hypothetical protein